MRDVATLRTARLRLEPLGPQHLEGTWAALHDPEGTRLTGTTQVFTRERVEAWLAGLAEQDDRCDWAVVVADGDGGEHVGEVVLNQIDPVNRSANFRIALQVRDRGYGTEATQAVVDHGFEVLRLHRIGLEVLSFNPRARHVYERCGFSVEGRHRDVLLWEGEWVDAIPMAILETDARPWRTQG